MTDDLLSSEQVAEMLHVHRYTIHRWVKSGRLTPVPLPGRNRRFRKEDIEALLAETAA